MEPKRSKYDTNPLDHEVADRATDAFKSRPPTEEVSGGPTRDIGRPNEAERANPESESPTRRIDDTAYPSVFAYNQPQHTTYQPPRVPIAEIYQPPKVAPPNIYQPPRYPAAQLPSRSRSVAGINIPEKWANMLPYFPGHIGAVAAVIELVLIPRHETRARFHAAQGLALQLAILILTGAFSLITAITDSSFGAGLFRAASTVFLIVSMIRVWKGKPHHIGALDQPANWLNGKIGPRK